MAKQRSSTNRKTMLASAFILTMLLAFSFLVLLLLGFRILSYDLTSDDTVDRSGGKGKRWVEVISWEPRASLYHNFLSKEECEYIIQLAKPHMVKSTVVDGETGKSVDSRVRTSTGTFLERGADKVIRDIERRIADLTFIPVEYGEGLQVLHYGVGEKYEPHYDYFLDKVNVENIGQRVGTFLMYLSDVEEGGETIFPEALPNNATAPWWEGTFDCRKGGLIVKPKMGNALLFWSLKPDTTEDLTSLHGGCR